MWLITMATRRAIVRCVLAAGGQFGDLARWAGAGERVVAERAGLRGALGEPAEHAAHRRRGQDPERAVAVADLPLGRRGEEPGRAGRLLLRLGDHRAHDLLVAPVGGE